LGFSSNQAKVYLALVSLEKSASVKSIETVSGVHREEVYRKLNDLQEMGFVERILTRPVTFRAVPLESVINIMLHRKSEEISNLQIETEKLLQDFKKPQKKIYIENETDEIILIPEHTALFEKAKNELDDLELCLDTICSWKKGIGWISSHNQNFQNALKRGVKIRFVIEKAEGYLIPKIVEKLQNDLSFELRIFPFLPPAIIGLYDRKKLLISTSSTTSFLESPVIWSNNLSLIGMAQVYFEKIWTESYQVDKIQK
jgi:sugar-specific transcriptional regulator TrmB